MGDATTNVDYKRSITVQLLKTTKDSRYINNGEPALHADGLRGHVVVRMHKLLRLFREIDPLKIVKVRVRCHFPK